VTRALVAIQGVSQHFGVDGASLPALESIDLEIPDGQFVSVVGPSGCGKSTLLSLVAGLRLPSRGAVRCDGELITAPMPRKVGVIFQEANLLPWLSAIDNVAFPLEIAGIGRGERLDKAREFVALHAQRLHVLLTLRLVLLDLGELVVKLSLLRVHGLELRFQSRDAVLGGQETGEEHVEHEGGEQHAGRDEKPRDRSAQAIRHHRRF